MSVHTDVLARKVSRGSAKTAQQEDEGEMEDACVLHCGKLIDYSAKPRATVLAHEDRGLLAEWRIRG